MFHSEILCCECKAYYVKTRDLFGVAFVIRFRKTLEANILKVTLLYCGTERHKVCWRFQNIKFIIEVQVKTIVGFIFKYDFILKQLKFAINLFFSKNYLYHRGSNQPFMS
jgi:hypothetical protein